MIGFLLCVASNAVGIAVGSVSGSLFIRGIIDGGALIFLLYSTSMVLGLASAVSNGFTWRANGDERSV